MARSIPRVHDDSLHVPTLKGNGTSIIPLGSAAWNTWVERARSFRFESSHSSFTARKEQRPGGWYWYAYRRRHGTLHIAYLGKSEELSIERLHTVATVLERAEGSTEKTRHQPQQQSFDASLQAHHRSGNPSSLELSGEDSLHEAQRVPKHNLPIQLTSLVGREPATVTATALLRRPEVRLLSMIGTGGIGKTRLAIEVATQLLEDFTDGISFVALAPLRDPDMVLPTIAHTLGLKDSASEPVTNQLSTYLRDKHLLLVLDNFEHLMPAAHVVGELVTTCPNLKLLVTSREVLHLRAEQQFSVPPLELPGGKHVANVESLSQYPALDLFMQRARTVKHDFQLNTINAQALVEICTHLDGLPLAIELAAARIKFLSPQALLARLDHRLHVLTSGARDLPERQQTLRNTIAWSYELLNAEEQRLFRRLSIFVGGCSLEALEAVCHGLGDGDGAGQLFERVASLIDKSLLQTTDQESEVSRLLMLETIREYGLEALAANGEMESGQRAHAAYYLALAEEAEPELEGPQQVSWLEPLEREHDNLRAALQWSLEQAGEEETRQRNELALRLAAALLWFWRGHGYYREGQDFLERALARSKAVAVPLQVKALKAAAQLAFEQGDLDRAEALFEECLPRCRDLGDTAGMALSLGHLGHIAANSSNFVLASSRIEESLALSREVGDVEGIALALWHFTLPLYYRQGKYARSLSLSEESLALFREVGNIRGIIWSLFGLAKGLFSSQGDPTKARALLEEGLALCREVGHKESMSYGLAALGEVVLQQGDAVTARSLLEESLLLAREMSHNPDIPSFLESLADVVAMQGEPAWAARLWGTAEALRQAREIPLPPVYAADYERAVAAARSQIGEQAFAAAWAQGRTMTVEQLLAAQGPVTIPPLVSTDPMKAPPVPKSSTTPEGLTAREVEVLRLVAQGLADAQIAEHLVISPHTVNSHLKSIYGKLQVSSRSAATRYAIEHHLM